MPTLMSPPPPPHRTNMNRDREDRHHQAVAADNNAAAVGGEDQDKDRSIALLDESSTVFDWSFHDNDNNNKTTTNKRVDNLNQQSQDVQGENDEYDYGDTNSNNDVDHHGQEDFGIMSPRQMNDKNRTRRNIEEEEEEERRRRSFGSGGDVRNDSRRTIRYDTNTSRTINDDRGNERAGSLLHGHQNRSHHQYDEEKSVTFDDSITIVGSPMPMQQQQQQQGLNDVAHQSHQQHNNSNRSDRRRYSHSDHRRDDRFRKTTGQMDGGDDLNNQSISSDISLTIDDDDDHHHHHNYDHSYGSNNSNQDNDHNRLRETNAGNSYYSQSQQSQIDQSDDDDDDRAFHHHFSHSPKQARLSSSSSALSLTTSPSKRSTTNYHRSDMSSDPSLSLSPIVYKDRPWPNRDEYQTKYESKVKETLSKFQSLYPGKLKDYKSMTPDEQATQRERVLALMERIRSGDYYRQNNHHATNQAANSTLGVATHRQRHQQGQSPLANGTDDGSTTLVETQYSNRIDDNDRIMDETMQPSFSPQETMKSTQHSQRHLSSTTMSSPSMSSQRNHHSGRRGVQSSTSRSHSSPDPSQMDRSCGAADKSELLLSPDEGSRDGENNCSSSSSVSMDFPQPDIDDNNNSNSTKDDSISSVEIPRGTSNDDEDGHHSGSDLSFGTPEDQVQRSSQGNGALKRQATTSGKRGADTQRSRYNDDGHVDIVSSRLGRMSISPQQSKRHSSSPDNLFPTSQSPISLRLTTSPNDKDDFSPDHYNNCSDRNERISWGTDEHRYSIPNSKVNDSVMTSRSLRPGQNNSRSIREVPTNVSLMDGATFHLDKLAVKRTKQLERSQSGRPKDLSRTGISALQRRRLVSFPDPFVKYNKRIRPALNEMHQWIQGAEHEFDEGESNIPALGVFFSLSYQQIIDLGLKLLLSDISRTGLDQSSTSMNGNTIIICRSKEDCGKWESSFRDGTGCSVLNHAALQLSERIRTATAEKACLHDIVLTTFDSMKSPDVAIPITDDGHVILKSPEAAVGWQSSRSGSQMVDATPQKTKQLSVLHRIHYKRVIFVDVVGRKCYLAKGGTARNAAATALSGDSRLAFFCKSEADGESALAALKKSDKAAFPSVSSALRLSSYENSHPDDDETDGDSSDDDDNSDGRNRSLQTSTIATIALDLNDLR